MHFPAIKYVFHMCLIQNWLVKRIFELLSYILNFTFSNCSVTIPLHFLGLKNFEHRICSASFRTDLPMDILTKKLAT